MSKDLKTIVTEYVVLAVILIVVLFLIYLFFKLTGATASQTGADVGTAIGTGVGAAGVGLVNTIGTAVGTGVQNVVTATQKCSTKYPGAAGENVFQNGLTKDCFKCPVKYPDRTAILISGTTASDKTCSTSCDKLGKYLNQSLLWDPSGWCYKCPANTSRNTSAITSSTPCQGSCPALYGSDSFQNVLSGQCYSCPGGVRNLNAAGSGKECTKGGLFGSTYKWTYNGLMNKALQYKYPTTTAATYLGTI